MSTHTFSFEFSDMENYTNQMGLASHTSQFLYSKWLLVPFPHGVNIVTEGSVLLVLHHEGLPVNCKCSIVIVSARPSKLLYNIKGEFIFDNQCHVFLQHRKQEIFMASQPLLVTCTIESQQKYEKGFTLLESLQSAFQEGILTNLIIQVEERQFKIHSAVLVSRSSGFRKLVEAAKISQDEPVPRIQIDEYSAEVVECFLHSLYGFPDSMKGFSFEVLVEVLRMADKYDAHCVDWCVVHALCMKIYLENCLMLLNLADELANVPLKQALVTYFRMNLTKVMRRHRKTRVELLGEEPSTVWSRPKKHNEQVPTIKVVQSAAVIVTLVFCILGLVTVIKQLIQAIVIRAKN